MTELNAKIKECGMRKSFIAEKLCISRQAFSNKISGKTPFTLNEAFIIARILHLTDDEFFYFFAPKGE